MSELIGLKPGDYYIAKRASLTPVVDREAAKALIAQQDFPGNWVVVKVKAVPNPPRAAVSWDE